MIASWPAVGLEAFLRALPLEHLLRKRAPEEALARWRTEANAYRDAERSLRIALLLDCTGDSAMVLETVACWASQTWHDRVLFAYGVGAEEACEWASRHGLGAVNCSGNLKQAVPAHGVEWLVPARGGDLLHPSLAGVVATRAVRGADAVAWDWLSSVRRGRAISVTGRHRAPWRDDVAELQLDQRGRAFAVPAEAWMDSADADAWHVRMSHEASHPVLHPEPLAVYAARDMSRPLMSALAARRLGVEFENAGAFPRPVVAAAGVSVIILYRDRVELTLRAIRSVLAQRFEGRLQLVLIDNQSSVQTKAEIDRCLAALPAGVTSKVVAYDAPFNHSRQCNLGVAAADEDVVLFLNNDVELLDPDALDETARWALLPGVSTVGICLVDADGRPSGGGFRCRRLPGAEFNSPVEEATGPLAARPRYTVGNTFACAAISQEAYAATGGLDDQAFPVGYNDVDFCLRAYADGRRHVNLGHRRAMHAVGASRQRTDEVAQKIALRCAHPWTLVRALEEVDDEAVSLPETRIPQL